MVRHERAGRVTQHMQNTANNNYYWTRNTTNWKRALLSFSVVDRRVGGCKLGVAVNARTGQRARASTRRD
jgi:hypothetical protein